MSHPASASAGTPPLRPPVRSPDWRDRMPVRGSAPVHTLARAGWAIGGLLGVLLVLAVAGLDGYFGAIDSPHGALAGLVGALLFIVPVGAASGAALGLLAQSGARAWLRTPTPVERAERRDPALFGASTLRPGGRWATHFDRCARSVRGYHGVVATVPAGAVRDWLTDVGRTLDGELAEALRLACLGESLSTADGARPGPTARRVEGVLCAAAASFAATTERAAAIVLDTCGGSDFLRVRAELDLLAEQAPQLRSERVG